MAGGPPALRSQPGSGARVGSHQSPILLPGSEHFTWLEHAVGDGSYFFEAVEEEQLVVGFFDADIVADDAVAGEDPMVLPANVSGSGDLAQQGVLRIFEVGEPGRPHAGAWPEAGQGGAVAEGLVRADGIVDVGSPTVDLFIEAFDRVARDIGQTSRWSVAWRLSSFPWVWGW